MSKTICRECGQPIDDAELCEMCADQLFLQAEAEGQETGEMDL